MGTAIVLCRNIECVNRAHFIFSQSKVHSLIKCCRCVMLYNDVRVQVTKDIQKLRVKCAHEVVFNLNIEWMGSQIEIYSKLKICCSAYQVQFNCYYHHHNSFYTTILFTV